MTRIYQIFSIQVKNLKKCFKEYYCSKGRIEDLMISELNWLVNNSEQTENLKHLNWAALSLY